MSQIGVDPPQMPMLVAEQAPHAPDDWQAGALAGQSASAPHERQVWLVPSHTGVVPLQLLLDRQATQTFGDTEVRQ